MLNVYNMFSEESSVGLCVTTGGGAAQMCWKQVPDGSSCNMETPFTELSLWFVERTCHVAQPNSGAPTRDVRDRRADMVEVGWINATDRIKGSDSHREQYPLMYWQPVEHV